MTQMIYSDCTGDTVAFFKCLQLSESTKYKHNKEALLNAFRKHETEHLISPHDRHNFNSSYFVVKTLVDNERKETGLKKESW